MLEAEQLAILGPDLVGKEVAAMNVALIPCRANAGQGVRWTGPLVKQNDKLVDATCLYYTKTGLDRFLGLQGNGYYRDNVVDIGDVQVQGSDVHMYAVLVGAAQFVNHYHSLGSPNCRFEFYP